MKHKRLSSLRQNILTKKSTINNEKKEKTILTNLYPYSLPAKFHDISNKNDELLIKKKIFNHAKDLNRLTLGPSYINSFKSISKNNSNIKNNFMGNKSKKPSFNKTKNNFNVSKSIDNQNNNKDLLTLNKKDNVLLKNLFSNNFLNNKKDNISLNKIKITRDDMSFFSDSGYRVIKNKNISQLNLNKTIKNQTHSITSINSRKNSAEKNNFLFKKSVNNNLLYNGNKTINKNQNYRKYLFNEKDNNKKNLEKLNENKKEIVQIINDHDLKNKGLFYQYNYQNNITNPKKKHKNFQYPSFNSPKHIAIKNSNLYNISKGENSFKKPLMILSPSSYNSPNQIQKENIIKEYNKILMEKDDLNLYNILVSDKSSSINDENNNSINKYKNYSTQKNKKKVNHLQIFSQNDINKNWNSHNISNININDMINLTNNNPYVKKKLKLKKMKVNNKTDLLLNNKNEIKNINRMIEKYSNLQNINKESIKKIFEKNLNITGDEQNKENNIKVKKDEIISKRQISVDSNITKNESKSQSNKNIIKKCKTLEKNEKLNENISEISKGSTAIKDANYYMEKSKSLINYIKDYYNKNNKYPETKIQFYLYGRKIGQGAFGKVNLGLNVLTGRVVAIKSFKKTSETKYNSNMKKILYETNLMKRFNHQNITKILEVFHDEEYMLIIMEYINGGNLFNFVKKRRKLSEKMAKFLFRQIILGIKHIHSQKIVHRDIKLENIIIDLNNTVKICDFGIGKVLYSTDELLYDKCGTPMYMAPEIILCNKKNGYKGFPVDIWSSGITLYIMLSGALPFTIRNKSNEDFSLNDIKNKDESSDLKYQIVNNNPKKIKNISKEAKDLLNGLLNKDPEKRLTCDEILNHPWLKNTSEYCDNNKYHLFTKAEMTMMSKTYIDYRKGELEDLRENFTITNLKSDEIKICEKNITTKSSILAPFNSAMKNKSSFTNYVEDEFDDFYNSKIKLENDLIIFNNKVKEFNLNYEINNNQEVDNGMLIKTKSDITSSVSGKNNSAISHNDNKFKIENNNDSIPEEQINEQKNKNSLTINSDKKEKNYIDEKNNFIDINNPKIVKILNEIESFGYQKEYIINCVKNNVLCHASTVFYLLKNYGDIE